MQTEDPLQAKLNGETSIRSTAPAVTAASGPVVVQPNPEPKIGAPQQATVPVVVVQSPEQAGAGAKEFLGFGQAFAWPLLILALAIIFRKQVARKIENMATFKTPVAESTWNAQAATVADVAEAIVNTTEKAPAEAELPAQPALEEHLDPLDDPAPTPEPHRYAPSAVDVSNVEAVGSVLLMWQALETSVKDLVASRNVSVSNFQMALRWLERSKIVAPTTLELIDQLRRLRNEVVHLSGTSVDSDSYRRSVIAVIETLEMARKETNPGLHTAPLVIGQSELATMPYEVLLKRMADDLAKRSVEEK